MVSSLSPASLRVLGRIDRVFHGEESDAEIVALVKADKSYDFVIHAMDRIGIAEDNKRFKDCPLAHMYVNRMESLGTDLFRRLSCY